LRLASSFLKDDATEEHIGIVMVISDVTETEVLKKKRRDAAVVFACVIACVCLYLLLLSALEFAAIHVPTKVLTQVINAMVFAFSIILYKKTDFSREELGLKVPMPKSTFVSAGLVSAAAVAALILAKMLLLKISPGFFSEDLPFWNWNIGAYSWISYIFTCIIQEFLARSMIYGSIRKLFDGRKATAGAILLSSLLFGAVHIAHGFMYMAAAIVLLGALGGLYEKQRSIWGVAVIHYVLGQTAACLGFLA
jgi:membrane protease YdiL (CAAX protease family)